MSLILDALRRADAERERGHVPGLHTPQPMAPAAVPGRGSRTPAVVVSVLAGAVAAGGFAAWWSWRQPGGAPAALAVAVAPAVLPAAAPLPALGPLPAPVSAPVPAPAPAAVVAPPVAAPVPVPVPKKVEVVKPPVALPARVPTLQELAPAVRQQLPSLAVSGASYSADPTYRMVIVNGQVLHEGDPAGNGVLLESIGPRLVVFKGLGVRWTQGY